MSYLLDIVIVNWNSGEKVTNLLKKLDLTNHEMREISIVVIDNASTDESMDILRRFSDNIRIISSRSNLGFAGGCNLGALYTSSPNILFLNPDIEVMSNTIVESISLLEKNFSEGIGIVGIKMIDGTNNITRTSSRFPRAKMFVFRNVGLDKIFPQLGHSMAEWDHQSTRCVDQVIGAFFLTKRSLFEKLNGFDERFFVYFEEVDYSYRAKQLGYKSLYVSDLQAYHEGEGTTKKILGKRLFYSLRSRLLYGRKHYGVAENILNFANTLLLEPISRSLFLVVSGKARQISDLYEGFSLLYQDLPNILFKKMKP